MKFNFSGLLCFVFSSSLKTAINIYKTRLHKNPLDDGFYIIFQCFLSSFYSLTGYTIIMPSPSLPRQREFALIQKNIFSRFIRTMVESSCVSPHKIYQCHILFDNSYSSSRYQPKSGVSWIPAQIWRSV